MPTDRRQGQRRQSPGRREEDAWYPTRGIIVEVPSPGRLAELRALADRFRAAQHHEADWAPFLTVKRERLERVEAMLSDAGAAHDRWVSDQHRDEALAEVRAILGKVTTDAG